MSCSFSSKIYFGMLNKNWENECRIRFLRKNTFEFQTKIDKKCDDDVLSRIKMCCKKNILCWKWKKGFLRKMLVGIKDDRDSVTRWENLQKRYGLRLDSCFLFCYFLKFHCAYFRNKAWN